MASTFSPGFTKAPYTAMLADAPEWGCRFAWSAPNRLLARSMPMVSALSTSEHPP